ncbi:MAG: hypothetical protein QOJ68_1363, partial [Blastococcus sp.]|nr:hypothetical protein [Blastococcus sp.]
RRTGCAPAPPLSSHGGRRSRGGSRARRGYRRHAATFPRRGSSRRRDPPPGTLYTRSRASAKEAFAPGQVRGQSRHRRQPSSPSSPASARRSFAISCPTVSHPAAPTTTLRSAATHETAARVNDRSGGQESAARPVKRRLPRPIRRAGRGGQRSLHARSTTSSVWCVAHRSLLRLATPKSGSARRWMPAWPWHGRGGRGW